MNLDVDEAAARAKCHPDTMRKLAAAREVPATKIGRRWVFPEHLLQEWMRLGTVKFWRNVRRQKRRQETRSERLPRELEYWAGYRAAKAHRSPAWADRKAILAIYRMARRVSDCLRIPFHVDHIVPLHGENVCGLHVERNLRVMPGRANQSKGRRFS